MTVRRGRPVDLPRLRAIQAAALAEPWPELLVTAAEGSLPLFVAAAERPVGYAIAVAPGGTAYLPELAVAPSRQGEGSGSALLDAVCGAVATDHGQLRLTVRSVDDRARRFYEKRGFEVCDRVHDHFESGDGLVLARPL